MVRTECKVCRRAVWRGMEGGRETLFEEAHEVFRFNGGVQSGLATASKVPGLYRKHRCPPAPSYARRKRTRWSGKSDAR